MSSTYVTDTSDDHKTDNTLIIIVNNDGTISVDQETLQNILANQQNTAVSVVRVGGPSQDDSSQDSNGTNDSQNDGSPHVNLTVEGFYPPSAVSSEDQGSVDDLSESASPTVPVSSASNVTAGAVTPNMTPGVDLVADLVSSTAPSSVTSDTHSISVNAVPPPNPSEGESLDPFLEMDPEQLERLETALQSEQAKQILGENVTAMLDMLSVEEEATQLKDSILMDHCYTNRSPATAPPPPPSTTPVVNQFTATGGRDDDGTLLLHQPEHIQQVMPSGMGPPTIQTVIRGRGRFALQGGRPGRPRRDGSSTRGATTASLRGITRGGLGRGGVKIQRGGTIVSGTGAGNMIMVQQIKQITPPLSASNSGTGNATLVPVVRPLVLTTSGTTQIPGGTVIRTPVAGQVQKQIITVPQGARLVAVQGKSSVETGGQQTVVLTNAAGQVVQTQQIQGALSVQSQLANVNNAKVVVAKMPVLPPQLLGAQPTTLAISEQSSQRLQKEDESDFTDFPQEPSEDSESEESDVGSDDEYRDPSVGDRRRGRGGKSRGRFGRGARSRGGFRAYDVNRGRGGRRGRGRGFVKLEDVDRVKKLDAEMAGFVAAMEKSPEHTGSVEKSSPQENREKPKKEEHQTTVDGSPGDGGKKKLMKVYGKSVKKIPGDEVQIKQESVVLKEKVEKSSVPHATPEKKSPLQKHSVKRQSPETPQPTSTPVAVTISNLTPSVAAPAVGDARKNYPKRENRKPPAHLAEALGPALFSTPDIIRRVSTGPDQKPIQDIPLEDKEAKQIVGANPTELISEEKVSTVVPELIEKDMHDPSSEVMEEDMVNAVLDPFQSDVMNSTEDILDQSLLLPLETPEEKSIDKSSLILKIVQESTSVTSDATKTKIQVQPTQNHPATKTPPLRSQPSVAVKRSSRRRNSTGVHQSEGPSKRESKSSNISTTKDKKRGEDNKQKGRRRPSEVDEDDDDEELPSSDDESWNSEDDPDRLWCICKKPHNNRFMICCDVCEDWFHGKCVGVTKAMGQQMENKGLEWSCPNCSKKKESNEKDSKKIVPSLAKEKDLKKIRDGKKDNLDKSVESLLSEVKASSNEPIGEGTSYKESSSEDQVMFCIVCKKEARSSSIYCSDICILKHAQESLNVINKEKAAMPGAVAGSGGKDGSQEQSPALSQSSRGPEASNSGDSGSSCTQSQRPRPDARVIVFERKSGRLLAGSNAPTAGNLKSWLKDNPTFEVVRPGILPTTKFYSAKVAGGKTVQQLVKTPLKPTTQTTKSQVSNASTSLQSKQVSQKNNNLPQKTVLVQQKLAFVPLKPTVSQPKTASSPAPSPIKVITPKVQKGPIVVPAQPQKVIVKASPKNTSVSSKPAKSPATVTAPNLKVPQSPSNKAAPSNISKAPATSTVKEAAKVQVDKTVAKKVEVKRQSSSSDNSRKEEEKEKPSGPEPIRLNIRKTLQELLQARIQECPDLQVSEAEVQSIAVNIEEEMHLFFRDTGLKYKSKYRSLVFNIKDPKNLTLFRKIADKSVTPHQLVRLSPEELASQELALWREREVKHQLEMIKKTELDLMSQAKTYVMKTHKGEQVIETDESLKVEVPELVDPSTVPDLVSPVNNSVSSTVEDTELDKTKNKLKDKDLKEKSSKEEKERNRDREKSRHEDKRRDKSDKAKREDRDRRDGHHDRHDRDKKKDNRERDKSKNSSRDKHHKSKHDDRHRDSKSSSSSSRSTSSSRKDKKEELDIKKEEPIKRENDQPDIQEEEMERETDKVCIKEESKDESDFGLKQDSFSGLNKELLEDSDLSDREPSSTVIIKTPDINTEDHEKNVCATVWKGFVNMPDVAKFFTTVQVVSGDSQNLCNDLPDTVDIVGRISPDTVWDYISKMKKTGTKEILVIRLTAASEEEKIPYITLYTYLNSRGRLGVVGNVSNMIKDFYIMPLASHLPVPQILLPLDGPGFEDYRPHLLIGILVRARRKRLAPENEYVAKMPKRIIPPPVSNEPVERSYTPPLPSSGTDAGSLTPPLYNTFYPSASGDSYTPPSSPHGFHSGPTLLSKTSEQRLSRIDNESLLDEYRLPDKPVEKKSLASHVGQYGGDDDDDEDDDEDEDDDDTPYSPGGSDDNMESSEENILLTPKNPVELQRKVEELNRKIEEQKQQIQHISSAIGSTDSTAALGTVTDSLKANAAMQSYMLGSSSGEATSLEEGDENEAYSPSRSFTPPATSIPFIGPADASSTPAFTKLTSNINLPSNLHEILATIKKQESDKAAGTKGINLKSDPIVQNYAKAAEIDSSQPKTPTDEFTAVINSGSTSSSSSSVLQSASSALLSLSTPVVHPLASGGNLITQTVSAIVVEAKVSRDPRQRGSETVNKTCGSTLSTLSDDDLIKKALEMEMELTEPKIKSSTAVAVDTNAVTVPSLQQPLPPGVDSLPTVPASAPPIKAAGLGTKPIVPSQPLPPGVEDEEYPSYSSFGVTTQNTVIPSMNIPVPPVGPSNKYAMRSPNSPATYHVPHPYPGANYNMGPSRGPPTGPGYSSSFPPPPPGGYPPNIEDSNSAQTSAGKRKFPDSEGEDSAMKRDRSDSPPSGSRETWDSKVPVPVRGRFSGRGRGFGRGAPPVQRGFIRLRGGVNRPPATPPPPPPLPPPSSARSRWDAKDERKRPLRYESNRSDWEPHNKDFDDKLRDRTRESRHRDRSRERDSKTSNSQRSHSTRSSRSRDSEKGSDSP